MDLEMELAPFGPEWQREQEDRRYGEPTYSLADHHAAWHWQNGRFGCPWDCSLSEPDDDGEPWWPADNAPADEWEAVAAQLFESSEWVAARDHLASTRAFAPDAADPWDPPF